MANITINVFGSLEFRVFTFVGTKKWIFAICELLSIVMFVKEKKLKRNTYKIISSDFLDGGFCIEFFKPYEDYNIYIESISCMKNIRFEQFLEEEIIIDKTADGWHKKDTTN